VTTVTNYLLPFHHLLARSILLRIVPFVVRLDVLLNALYRKIPPSLQEVAGFGPTDSNLSSLQMLTGVVRAWPFSTGIFIAILGAGLAVCAQEAKAQEPLRPAVASSSSSAPLGEPSASGSALPTAPDPDAEIDVSWRTLPIDILRDQKYVWLFPVDLAKGHHLRPTLGVAGVTAGLIAADPPSMRYFGRTTDFNRYTETFNGTFTGAAMGAVPASLYVFGLVRHDSYAEQTALLAGEAYADSAIPHVAMKIVSRRLRPNAVPPTSDYSDTFFRSSVSVFGKGSSFPSGHAAGAFSIATVIARRYGNHRWVPWAAYGIAGVFSFSRLPARAHFPSDVFLGAALGYTITRYDVFRAR
jgi:membrane-associated phospholipid phosphatase